MYTHTYIHKLVSEWAWGLSLVAPSNSNTSININSKTIHHTDSNGNHKIQDNCA